MAIYNTPEGPVDFGDMEEAEVLKILREKYPPQTAPADSLDTQLEAMSGETAPPQPQPSFLDTWGRPIAETGGALIGGTLGIPGGPAGIMVGAGLGGEVAGRISDYLGGEEQLGLADTVKSTAFNMVGGPAGPPASSLRQVGDQFAQAPVSAFGTPALPQLLDASQQRMGLPELTAGQRGSTTAQAVEGALEGTVSGTGPIRRQKENLVDSFADYVSRAWPNPSSREAAGGRAVAGMEPVAASWKATTTQLYDELDTLLNQADSGRISVPESQRLLGEIEAKYAADPEWAQLINTDPDLTKYLNTARTALEAQAPAVIPKPGGVIVDAQGGRLMPDVVEEVGGSAPEFPLYDTLKQFRTTVGRKLGNPWTPALGGVEAEKKRLYGALSEDLAAGAEELGGVGARQARSRADWFNRGMMERLEVLDPIFKNADNPTKVYDAMKNGVYNNPTMVAAAKKTLPPEAWGEFTDTFVRDLLAPSNASTEKLSFNTIVTNLNKLKRQSPEGYAMVFQGREQAVEDVLRVASKLKEAEGFINRSRTGNVRSLLGPIETVLGAGTFAATGNIPAAAGAVGLGGLAYLTPNLLARAMTNPTLARAVRQVSEAPSMVRSAQDFARALVAAGADEAEVAQLIEESPAGGWLEE